MFFKKNDHKKNELEFEKLKMIYDKSAEMTRYYLNWRQLLVGGYFVIGAFLGSAVYTLLKEGNNEIYICLLLAIMSVLAICFYYLDRRNRELYRRCIDVGSRIENRLFANEIDDYEKNKECACNEMADCCFLFYKMRSVRNNKKITHSNILAAIYLAGSVIPILFLFIYLYLLSVK